MRETFFERPILNSPYEVPDRHWKLGPDGVPTDEIAAARRAAEFLSPVPPPKPQRGGPRRLALGEARLSTAEQQYDPYPVINRIRQEVDRWRELPEAKWGVTRETALLLRHWRSHEFSTRRPFFCQVEAVETAIWLVEAAGLLRESGENLPHRFRRIWKHLHHANRAANPQLLRVALKMATGAGKTTVMAMLIAWQTVNAVRHPKRRSFTRGFLVVTPGITIRDRLRVLLPNDPNSYFRKGSELVPREMLGDLQRAEIVITNFHAFQRRERMKLAKGTRSLLQGRGTPPSTVETEGEMLRRVMSRLLGKKHILVLNDEGHHCYREKAGGSEEGRLVGEEREEAQKNQQAARVWIRGIETVRRKIGVPVVFDLSATPFFLRGSGYAEGTLFPWTVSDFSLMDAIESGIVKLPRVPVSDSVNPDDRPRLRDLWEHIGKKMPRKGRRQSAGSLDPGHLPPLLETAFSALYSHYEKTFDRWQEAGIETPPVFIVVCSNTAASKLVHDYLAGYERKRADGETEVENGRLELFRNYDENGTRLPRPRTLLIDSEQIESGDALDPAFRKAAKDQIERFRREIVDRTGSRADAEAISDADLLREAMNTVGKPGRLGEDIRCVVSVSMLTEGWDANTVTHILGIRAFGTQLLCEQVVGRALRRQSYERNSEGRFDPEYAEVLGIPFDFTGKPVPVPLPKPPPPVTHVHAVRPERDALEIRFPRVAGYRRELPEDRLTARFTADSTIVLTPALVGPMKTTNQGIVGLPAELRPDRNQDIREATLAFHLARDLLRRHLYGAGEEPRFHLFGQVKRIVRDWLRDGHLVCEPGTHRGQLLYEELAAMACERITAAVTAASGSERLLAVLDPWNPEGSTGAVDFRTSKTTLWRADPGKCPVNWAVCDLSWEEEFCRVVEAEPSVGGVAVEGFAVEAYVKNAGLGFEVPYRLAGEAHRYLPDFIVRVRDGAGEPVHIVVEVKGRPDEKSKAKAETMRSQWVPGVNGLGTFGRWAFLELRNISSMAAEFRRFVGALGAESEAA